MSELLKKIADEANVSTATVRRAMNDDSRVRKDTRERVKGLAYRFGYRPNGAARSLKLGLKTNVGLVFARPGEEPIEISIREYASLISSMAGELERSGRSLMMTMASEDITPGKFKLQLPRIAEEGHTSQLIILSHMWPTFAEEIQRFRIKAMVIDGPSCGLPVIQRDEELAMETAVDYLVGLGHTRIAFINHYGGVVFNGYRDASWPRGYLKSLLKHHLSPVPGWDGFGEDEVGTIKRLLKMDNRPTAIITYDEVMAIHFAKHLMDAGVSVPRDMSIIAMRGYGAYYLPEVTRVSMPHEKIAKEACNILEQWDKGADVPDLVTVSGEIVPGGTTARVDGQPADKDDEYMLDYQMSS